MQHAHYQLEHLERGSLLFNRGQYRHGSLCKAGWFSRELGRSQA